MAWVLKESLVHNKLTLTCSLSLFLVPQENEARVLKALRKALIHRPQPLPSKIRKGQTRSKSTVVCSRPRSMTAMARSMSTTAQA